MAHEHHSHTTPDQDVPVNEGAEALVKALRVLFVGLRILMVILVVLLFRTGYFTVQPDEQVLTFRFGKLQNDVYESGQAKAYWIWPQPIGNTLSLPSKSTPLTVETTRFWQQEEKRMVPQPGQEGVDSKSPFMLGKDGYVITGDSYAFHMRCTLTYTITNAVDYYRAFYKVDKAKNFNKKDSELLAKKIIGSQLEQAVTMECSNWQVDDAFYGRLNDFRQDILQRVQKNIEPLNFGITVERIDIKSDDRAPLKQVQGTFNKINQASTEAQKVINLAQQKSSEIELNAEKKAIELKANAEIYEKRLINLLTNYKELDERFSKSGNSDLLFIYQQALTVILSNVEHRFIIRHDKEGKDTYWLELGPQQTVDNSQNGDESSASSKGQ